MQIRTRHVVALAILLLALPSCNSSNSPSAPENPPGPSQASIIMGVTFVSVEPSPVPGFTTRVTLAIPLGETAGVGATIDVFRLDIFVGGAQSVETQQLNLAAITEQTGSSRLEGNGQRNLLLAFDFNTAGPVTGRVSGFFTDDLGNALTENGDFDFPS